MIDKLDFWFFAGLLLIGAGAWMVYPPAALIGPGVILVGVSIFGVPK